MVQDGLQFGQCSSVSILLARKIFMNSQTDYRIGETLLREICQTFYDLNLKRFIDCALHNFSLRVYSHHLGELVYVETVTLRSSA